MEPNKPRRLKLRNNSEHHLTQEDIVNATLAFANGDAVELIDLGNARERGLSDAVLGDAAILKWEERAVLELGKKRARTLKEIKADTRSQIRENLNRYINDPLWPRDSEAVFDRDYGADFDLEAYFRYTARGCSLDFYFTFTTDLDLFVLGELLIEDIERPFGKRLCQCQLKTCGRFFFEIKPATGRPQRKYCCHEHLKKAHALDAPKRMRRVRNNPRRKK